MKFYISCAAISLLFLGFYSSSAHAFTYGNPARVVEPGKFYVGFAASEFEREFDTTVNLSGTFGSVSGTTDGEKIDISRQTIVFGYGATEEMILEFSIGQVSLEDDFGDEFDGSEFGGLLLMKGFLISLRLGAIDNEDLEGDFTQIDVGYGLSREAGENLSLYGMLLFSKASATLNATPSFLSELSSLAGVTITSASLELEEDTAIGIVGGLDYKAGENIAVAFEIHALFETGFGLRLTAGF